MGWDRFGATTHRVWGNGIKRGRGTLFSSHIATYAQGAIVDEILSLPSYDLEFNQNYRCSYCTFAAFSLTLLGPWNFHCLCYIQFSATEVDKQKPWSIRQYGGSAELPKEFAACSSPGVATLP